jgi:hypothetical protein
MNIRPDDNRALVTGGSSGIGGAITWVADGWVGSNQADTTEIGALKLRFADLATKDCVDGAVIEFTFFWKKAQHRKGGNYPVTVDGPTHKEDDDVAKHGVSIR